MSNMCIYLIVIVQITINRCKFRLKHPTVGILVQELDCKIRVVMGIPNL